ncbi:hypothetical protein CO112_02885 [Candidatus Dojkabacteria bacterium CG_4_9_14_3_um_filter_150_Dojkabacteria_WS6_41_13]|uniref:Uncharacterized protein n=1 Tax=Candidatus Dojkabacteria bacterium CG_4_10_14_0_2_um_filter_Dojkabacteria_WS6_41_15 TaxID=2014249 RepID=A0A2M7W1H7_9BACT|nr:MAG: hypothetical protein COX64_03840 [Candidatus Dojkabacteria bacterium CG_4_10_14_0_2_um_filter_Dojkabacteria_WS6_41_15]PJB22732.1 MAG: hypothetical protein CO112_02885 [Candidatus Dojkabacteria bacterium CG_4_9_14_3_um_filter_150_Dojkabacteria_WS6_41_13]
MPSADTEHISKEKIFVYKDPQGGPVSENDKRVVTRDIATKIGKLVKESFPKAFLDEVLAECPELECSATTPRKHLDGNFRAIKYTATANYPTKNGAAVRISLNREPERQASRKIVVKRENEGKFGICSVKYVTAWNPGANQHTEFVEVAVIGDDYKPASLIISRRADGKRNVKIVGEGATNPSAIGEIKDYLGLRSDITLMKPGAEDVWEFSPDAEDIEGKVLLMVFANRCGD